MQPWRRPRAVLFVAAVVAGVCAICKQSSVRIALTFEAENTLKSRNLGIGADGIFGYGTERAVKAFQRGEGLIADGIVGGNTWTAIKKHDGGSGNSGGSSAGGGDG